MEFEDQGMDMELSSPDKMSVPMEVIGDAPPVLWKPRYRECLKNHAVGIGGQAVDGCCEFMPAGAEGTLDALKCAACNCHRNFHRKETNGGGGRGGGEGLNLGICQYPVLTHHTHGHFSTYDRTPSGYLHVTPHHQTPLALPSTSVGGGGGEGSQSREELEDMSNPININNNNRSRSRSSKKRYRTKFSAEQKEKMLDLAERLGWRIQKQEEAMIQQFCDETGVNRHVLKVWMHNNKHTLGKKT